MSEDSVRRDLRELGGRGALPARVRRRAAGLPRGRRLRRARSRRRRQQGAGGRGRRGADRAGRDGDPRRRHDGARDRATRCRATCGRTVITHSPTIAVALVDHPRSRSSCSAAGCSSTPWSPAAPPRSRPRRQVTADLFFLGVTGVHPDAGLTTGDADEAAMKRAPRAARPTRTCSAAPRRSAPRPATPSSPLADVAGDHHRRAGHRPHARAARDAGVAISSPRCRRP